MNAIEWFEIPALDLERAFQFYSFILNNQVRKGSFGNGELILFNVPFSTGEAVGGSIVVRDGFIPSSYGPIIYLNTFGKLTAATQNVEIAGGKLIQPCINLGQFGYAAIIVDSEGNTIGLLSHDL